MTDKKRRPVKTIVLDRYALLAYFEKEDGWDTVVQLLADAAAGQCALCGCVVNWGEVLYITSGSTGRRRRTRSTPSESLPVEWVDADRALTREAARFTVDGGLAYTDCFAAGLVVQGRWVTL
jgi:ribonuclease VapC